MTADEYLSQIATYNSLVDGKIGEIQQLWDLATKITVPTDKEAIQTSGISDKVGSIASKLADAYRELDDVIDEYVDKRDECLKVIDRLADKPIEYVAIHGHYVQFKSYVEIAENECYSYQGIMSARKRALKRIEDFLRKKDAES